MSSRSLLWLFAGGLVGFSVILAVVLLRPATYQYQGSLVESDLPAADFSLTDQKGRALRMSDQAGKVVLLFFGYTGCPDVCPATLAEFKKVHQALGDQAEDVVFLFITVDPERDTPQKMGEYVGKFHPEFIGLSGGEEDLEKVWQDYFIYREAESHEPGEYYTVDHTARIYAIDRAGNLRLTFPFGLGAQAITEDVRQLLME